MRHSSTRKCREVWNLSIASSNFRSLQFEIAQEIFQISLVKCSQLVLWHRNVDYAQKLSLIEVSASFRNNNFTTTDIHAPAGVFSFSIARREWWQFNIHGVWGKRNAPIGCFYDIQLQTGEELLEKRRKKPICDIFRELTTNISDDRVHLGRKAGLCDLEKMREDSSFTCMVRHVPRATDYRARTVWHPCAPHRRQNARVYSEPYGDAQGSHFAEDTLYARSKAKTLYQPLQSMPQMVSACGTSSHFVANCQTPNIVH